MPTIEHLLIPQIQKQQEKLKAALPPPTSYLAGYPEPGGDLPGVDMNAPGVAVPEAPSVEPYVWHDPTIAPAAPVAPPVGYLGAPQRRMWMDMPATKEQLHGKAAADVAYRELTSGPKYIEQGKVLKQMEETDPRLLGFSRAIGQFPNSPGYLQFKNAALGAAPVPEVAQLAGQERALAAAQAAQAAPEATKDKNGKTVLKLPVGQPIGYAEDGQMVDRVGKKLGYLREDQGAMRTLERGPKDAHQEDTDKFGLQMYEKAYGPYLKALDENDGQWPDGIFKGKSEEDRKAIHEGVLELRKRQADLKF